MTEQFDIFGNAVEVKPTQKLDNKEKRNWENAFQRWSNKMAISEPTLSFGKCGYGSMCDYCEENDKGRPCVRALNEKCRVENRKIDYSKREFNLIWGGLF